MYRRTFITSSLVLPSILASRCSVSQSTASKSDGLKLSLSQWALHREQFGKSKENYAQWQKWLETDADKVLEGPLKPLDFPSVARKMNFDAVEYVNTFFYRKEDAYFKTLRQRSDDANIQNLLIMVDEEGLLGHPDATARNQAIERHKRWLQAAAILGCHSIRVNAHSIGKKDVQQQLAADGLARLCELAEPFRLNVIIENHGGMSSHPEWLVNTIRATGKSNIGTMVDFDNFDYSETKIWGGENRYNRYLGVELLMPYAKSVSSKAHAFDDQGYETSIDFEKMIKIVKKAKFKGYVSVEYEGNGLSERNGIEATTRLLKKYI